MIQPFTRGSVLPPQPKPTKTFTIATDDNQKKQSVVESDAYNKSLKLTTTKNQKKQSDNDNLEFHGVIALIVFVIVLCVLCCGGRNKANVHLDDNDPRNHSPSPSDLVINIRTSETNESTDHDTSTNSTSTASTVSLEKLESNSSSVLAFTFSASETSQSDQTNDANDTSITDDFSI